MGHSVREKNESHGCVAPLFAVTPSRPSLLFVSKTPSPYPAYFAILSSRWLRLFASDSADCRLLVVSYFHLVRFRPLLVLCVCITHGRYAVIFGHLLSRSYSPLTPCTSIVTFSISWASVQFNSSSNLVTDDRYCSFHLILVIAIFKGLTLLSLHSVIQHAAVICVLGKRTPAKKVQEP